VLLRLGHAHALRGDVDEALEYLQPLAERDPQYRHQVAADLVTLAVAARERGAEENMSRSVEPLLEWGIGYVSADLLLSLARHYAGDGDYARSLGLYLSVLADSERPDPAVVYETGRAYEELGGCERALPYFKRYVDEVGRQAPDRDAARWHLGNCLFQTADEDRAAGRPRAALDKLQEMISLGVPRTILPNAHFLRGEMLLSIGDTESALGAYRRVLDLNPSRTGAIVRAAEERIRQIRFGFPND
jgi:tetratricopeptide (TPR) repeat protein